MAFMQDAKKLNPPPTLNVFFNTDMSQASLKQNH